MAGQCPDGCRARVRGRVVRGRSRGDRARGHATGTGADGRSAGNGGTAEDRHRTRSKRRHAGGKSMKVLATGGAGFLGSHLTDAFLDRGDEVFVLDDGPSTKIQHRLGHERFHFVQDSILDETILESLIARVDLVYHYAAVVGVQHYVVDPYKVLNVNVNGTQNVLKLAYKHERRVVFASTSEVYGRNPKVPWREEDDRVLGPTSIDRWCYSTSKAVGEHFCFAYAKLGLPVTILRYFNVYGPRLDGMGVGRVVTIFLSQAFRNKPLTVVGDGS